MHRAGQKRAEVVDFGPRAPAATNPATYKLTGRMTTDLFAWPEVEGDINIHGPLSVAIPASVAGYDYMHRQWGRLPLSEVIAPAIALAKRGLPQDWYTTLKVATSASAIKLYPSTAAVYLPNGLPPAPPYQGKPGFFRQGNLPDTMERLGKAGLRDFYEGDIAASIAADIRALGGVVSLDDLRDCQVRTWPAEEVGWRGRTLQLTGGLTAAPTLKRVLEGMADAPYGGAEPSPAWYRALARVMKSAYEERLAGLGESEPLAAESCTTHLTACDAEGNTVAVTTTLMSSFGSRVLLPQSGVLLNNGMMWFDPRTRRAEFDRAGQAPTVQHAADHPGGERPAVRCRWRFRRAPHHGSSVPAHDVHRRFRHGRGHRGTSSAHRRVQRRQGYSRRATAGRGARCVGGRQHAGGGGAQRGAHQLRLPERHRAVSRRHTHRHQRCGVALVRRGGAGLIILSPILH